MKFSIKDLVTFTEKILTGKLHFLCSGSYQSLTSILFIFVTNLCQLANHSCLNPFYATGVFLYPRKHQKIAGFLMFSRSLEKDQWHETG